MALFTMDSMVAALGQIPLDNRFILEYMPLAKGEHVKVYLYGLMHSYYPSAELSMEQAVQELNLTENEITAALRYWERKGLVVRVSDQPPVYRFLTATCAGMQSVPRDTEYERFAESLYALFGNDRRLHGKEISTCYEWVEDLHLPAEVVLMLISHMISVRGRNFSMTSAQKQAVAMADAGINTVQDAEAFFAMDRQVRDGAKKILRRFGKRREPSEDEMNLYAAWVRDWGYTPEAIEAACAETTGGDPSFKYLNGILKGMMDRRGTSLKTAEDMRKAAEMEQQEDRFLRDILTALGKPDMLRNQGVRDILFRMRTEHSDEMLLLAAQRCAGKSSSTLDSLNDVLETWQNLSLRTPEDVQRYLAGYSDGARFVRKLYILWNRPEEKIGSADVGFLNRWKDEWHFDEVFIVSAAHYAAEAERPMKYLYRILESCHNKGITTIEALEKDHEQHANTAQPVKKTGKVVREQLYDQREYEDDNDAMDRLMAQWTKEQENRA